MLNAFGGAKESAGISDQVGNELLSDGSEAFGRGIIKQL